jgi:hypothetical protein
MNSEWNYATLRIVAKELQNPDKCHFALMKGQWIEPGRGRPTKAMNAQRKTAQNAYSSPRNKLFIVNQMNTIEDIDGNPSRRNCPHRVSGERVVAPSKLFRRLRAGNFRYVLFTLCAVRPVRKTTGLYFS